MKSVTIFLLTIVLFSVKAQYDNTSFFFDDNNMDSSVQFRGFSEMEVGYYDLGKDSYKQMVVSQDSICVRTGHQVILPKSDALAKGFTFDTEKMYGMAPLNGIYYKEVNDTIFALYYQVDNYLSPSKGDRVIPVEDGYLLLMREANGFFSCEMVSFKGKKLSIHSIDHTLVMDQLLKLSSLYSKNLKGIKTYIANPKIEELALLPETKVFTDVRSYVMNKEL